MKRLKAAVICFLFIVFATLMAACGNTALSKSEDEDSLKEPAAVDLKELGEFSFDEYEKSVETLQYAIEPLTFQIPLNDHGNEVNVVYPKITLCENDELQEGLNDIFYNMAFFNYNENFSVEELKELYNIRLYEDYIITYFNESMVSILFHFDSFGGSSADEYYKGITFSLIDGEIFDLDTIGLNAKSAFLAGKNPKWSYLPKVFIDSPMTEEIYHDYSIIYEDDYPDLSTPKEEYLIEKIHADTSTRFFLSEGRIGFILYVGGVEPTNVVYGVDID